MPRYYEDKPEDGACAGVKEDLGACLLQSDCVLQEGKSPRQCLKEGNCRALQYSFFECKRSMDVKLKVREYAASLGEDTARTFNPIALDARSRFRGRKGY